MFIYGTEVLSWLLQTCVQEEVCIRCNAEAIPADPPPPDIRYAGDAAYH